MAYNSKLEIIHVSSELISAIEERYRYTGMKVLTCKPRPDNKFILEFGNWDWEGEVEFIGKQYFKTKKFSCHNFDGYDDPKKFICELLGIEKLGDGGIAKNWYRNGIPIPDGFIFDKTISLQSHFTWK